MAEPKQKKPCSRKHCEGTMEIRTVVSNEKEVAVVYECVNCGQSDRIATQRKKGE